METKYYASVAPGMGYDSLIKIEDWKSYYLSKSTGEWIKDMYFMGVPEDITHYDELTSTEAAALEKKLVAS